MIFNYVFYVIVTTVKSMSSTSKSILCEFISIDNYEGFGSTKCVGEAVSFLPSLYHIKSQRSNQDYKDLILCVVI